MAGRAVVVDVSGKCAADPDYRVTVADLEADQFLVFNAAPLFYTINGQLLASVDAATNGTALPTESETPPASWAFNPDVQGVERDVEATREHFASRRLEQDVQAVRE